MVNFSSANSTNATNTISREGDKADVLSVAGAINVIIINTITCPFTVILNLLVIKAVKSTPRLRTNSNILLACLAVTDALTGLLGQPLFVLWKIFLLFGLSDSGTVENCFATTVVVILTASYFHLMLVTLERLLAIKFTMQYPNFITDEKIKRAV
nr:alpha-1B adrenergic receptor-like [Pocillopora verrucosa]